MVWDPFALPDLFSIPVPRCSGTLSSGFIGITCISMCSNNSYVAVLRTQSMFWLLNQSISRENLEYSFRYSNVVFEDLWTQPVNICRGNSLLKITRCICRFNFYAWNSSTNRNRHLSLTRLGARSFGIFRNKNLFRNVFRNIFRLFCSWK